MKSIWCAAVLISVASVAIAEDEADEKATELEGSWTFVALQVEDKMAPEEVVQGMKAVIHANELTIESPSNEKRKSSILLATDKSPKAIDMTALNGPDKGRTVQGIYKIEDGKLTICIRNVLGSKRGRPKEFKAGAESGAGIMILKRVEED